MASGSASVTTSVLSSRTARPLMVLAESALKA
jgi:hypothetical protein